MQIKISELDPGVAEKGAVVAATNASGTFTEKVLLGDIADLREDWEVAAFQTQGSSSSSGGATFSPYAGRKYYLPPTDSVLAPWDVEDPQPGINGEWYFFWNQSMQPVRVGGVEVPRGQIVARICSQAGPGSGTWSTVVVNTHVAGSGSNSVSFAAGGNTADGSNSSVLAGQNNSVNGHTNAHILGSGIVADTSDSTFVNNLKVMGTDGFGGVTFPDGTVQTTAAHSGAVAVGLSYSATVVTDSSLADIFDLTLSGDVVLANPINAANGKTIRWRITQDSSGGRSVTLGDKFVIPSSATSPLPFSVIAGKTDILGATYHAGRDKWDVVAFVYGY